jgi:hypothetical protein
VSHAITDEILQSVSQGLGDLFDSHALIFAVMRQHPREYTTDLYGFVTSPDPIMSLHASIDQRLLCDAELLAGGHCYCRDCPVS